MEFKGLCTAVEFDGNGSETVVGRRKLCVRGGFEVYIKLSVSNMLITNTL